MAKKMCEKMKEIRAIEDKYGLVLFRTGLTHLVDVGHRHMGDKALVEKNIAAILAQGEKDKVKVKGKLSIMTPEFQCDILRCAAELANHSIWTLFEYIKKYVVVDSL